MIQIIEKQPGLAIIVFAVIVLVMLVILTTRRKTRDLSAPLPPQETEKRERKGKIVSNYSDHGFGIGEIVVVLQEVKLYNGKHTGYVVENKYKASYLVSPSDIELF